MYLKVNNLLRKTDQCETRQNGLWQPKKCRTADAWFESAIFYNNRAIVGIVVRSQQVFWWYFSDQWLPPKVFWNLRKWRREIIQICRPPAAAAAAVAGNSHSMKFSTLRSITIPVSTLPENTHHRGKYHWTMTDLLFDQFEFDQTSQIVVHSSSWMQIK